MVMPKVINQNGLSVVDCGDGAGGINGRRVPQADNDPVRATYSLYASAYAPVATPGDWLEILGAANRITRIRQLTMAGTATAASNVIVGLILRSAPDTIALNPAIPLIARDPTFDPALTTVRTASANPSAVGATARGAGFAGGGRLNLAPAANGGIDRVALQLSWLNDAAPTLIGANDCLYVTFATNTTNLTGPAWPSGGVIDFELTLTEELAPGA